MTSATPSRIDYSLKLLKENSPKMQSFVLGMGSLTVQQTLDLLAAIEDNTTLRSLAIGNVEWSAPMFARLAKAIAHHKSLIALQLCDLTIPKKSLKFILDAIHTDSHVQYVTLNRCDIKGARLRIVSRCVADESCVIKLLRLTGNGITNNDMEEFSKALALNNSLETLCMENNMVSKDCLPQLAESLRKNETLTKLSIADAQNTSLQFKFNALLGERATTLTLCAAGTI